jgi:hypothetical protein
MNEFVLDVLQIELFTGGSDIAFLIPVGFLNAIN